MKKYLAYALAILGTVSLSAQSVKISDLPAAAPAAGTEKMPAVQAGTTVAITTNQIATLARSDRQPLDSDLTAISALTTTSTGRDILTSVDAADIRTKAALGSIATQSASSVSITGGSITGITDLAIADGGTGASTAADARTSLGITATGSDTTYAYRANNLSDLASASTARTNLGLATIAASGSAADLTGSVPVANGGTGTTSLGSGVSTLLTTPSSANLMSAITDEVYGSGKVIGGTAKTSWTPRLAIGGSSTGITYASQNGFYSRIGDTVTISVRLGLSSRGGLSGAVTLEDLPFTIGANGSAPVRITSVATSFSPAALVNNATTQILFYNSAGSQLQGSDITDSSTFYITATYFI